MGFLTGLFSGPYAILARIALYGLLVIALVGYGFFKGNEHGTAKLDTYLAKQASETARITVARSAVTERIVTQYITKTVPQTQVVTNTVENEVIKYVDANPTGMCIDARWLGLHNSAASNTLPEGVSSAP